MFLDAPLVDAPAVDARIVAVLPYGHRDAPLVLRSRDSGSVMRGTGLSARGAPV